MDRGFGEGTGSGRGIVGHGVATTGPTGEEWRPVGGVAAPGRGGHSDAIAVCREGTMGSGLERVVEPAVGTWGSVAVPNWECPATTAVG